MWLIFQLSIIFLVTHLAKIKDQALHTHPYNLHFLKGYLKELCIHMNGWRQQLVWSPDRVKGMCSVCPWPVHTVRFFQSLSLACQSEITMLQALRDQSIEHQIVLWRFYLSIPWSPSTHSLSWTAKIHLRHVPHSSHNSRWGGLPYVTASDSSWLDQPVLVLHQGFHTAPLPSPRLPYSEIVSGGPLPLLQILNTFCCSSFPTEPIAVAILFPSL